jgi:hypothetical protein
MTGTMIMTGTVTTMAVAIGSEGADRASVGTQRPPDSGGFSMA